MAVGNFVSHCRTVVYSFTLNNEKPNSKNMDCKLLLGLLLILSSILTTPGARNQPANLAMRPTPKHQEQQHRGKPNPRRTTIKPGQTWWNKKRPHVKAPKKVRGDPGPRDWYTRFYFPKVITNYYRSTKRTPSLVAQSVPVICAFSNATFPRPRPALFPNRTAMTIDGQVIDYTYEDQNFTGTTFKTFFVSLFSFNKALDDCRTRYSTRLLPQPVISSEYMRFETAPNIVWDGLSDIKVAYAAAQLVIQRTANQQPVIQVPKLKMDRKAQRIVGDELPEWKTTFMFRTVWNHTDADVERTYPATTTSVICVTQQMAECTSQNVVSDSTARDYALKGDLQGVRFTTWDIRPSDYRFIVAVCQSDCGQSYKYISSYYGRKRFEIKQTAGANGIHSIFPGIQYVAIPNPTAQKFVNRMYPPSPPKKEKMTDARVGPLKPKTANNRRPNGNQRRG